MSASPEPVTKRSIVDSCPRTTRKIAMIVPDLHEPGGIATVADFLWRLIGSDPRLEVRVICIALASRDPESLLLSRPSTWLRGVSTRRGEYRGMPFVHVGAKFGELEFQRLLPRKALTKLIADCDVVQVVSGTPCWAMSVIGLGKPVVAVVASRTAVERRRALAHTHGILGWFKRWMARRVVALDERALRSADAVLVMNPAMLAHATEAARGRNVLVRFAPPGVDTDRFIPPSERSLRPGYILTVGRLDDPRKNVELLLEAYALLHRRMPSVPDLVLAGWTGPGGVFWNRVAELGLTSRIRFVEKPSREDLARLYQDATVFALSSDEEGFGLVLVEAMASGIPVISTRSGGPDGIITHEEDGFLVALQNALELADRLYQLISDEALNRRMGRAARANAVRRFSVQAARDVYMSIYDQLAERSFPR